MKLSLSEEELLLMCEALNRQIKVFKSISNISIESQHSIEIYSNIIRQSVLMAPQLFKAYPQYIDAVNMSI